MSSTHLPDLKSRSRLNLKLVLKTKIHKILNCNLTQHGVNKFMHWKSTSRFQLATLAFFWFNTEHGPATIYSKRQCSGVLANIMSVHVKAITVYVDLHSTETNVRLNMTWES